MTVHAFADRGDPTRIDLHNKIDPETGVRYLGSAWCDVATGRWLCLADVGSLCVVEVRLIISGEGEAAPDSEDGTHELRIVVDNEKPEGRTSDPKEKLAS